MIIRLAAAALLAFVSTAEAKITRENWGDVPDGGSASLFTLTNAAGMEARITNYGGVIVSLKVPGRDGRMANVVQGFDSLADYTSADYLKTHGHYGAIIGRYANRIKGADVVIDGRHYALDRDANGDADHGGEMAYFRQVFAAAAKDGPEPSLVLTHTDPDGFMGFPGKVEVTVTYTLTAANVLRIDYRASTDKPTIINLTNHSYFNLAGEGPGTVDNQVMQLFAGHYLPVTTSGGAVPTGEIRDVAGTVFDFRQASPIGPHLAAPEMGKGLDHTYVIDGAPGTLRAAARLTDPGSGRTLEVWTTQPGMQVYSANGVRPKVALEVKHYVAHGAMSFQTQHYPDSPHHPNFPSVELRPGKPFHEVTEFRFSVAR
jgi:aldose 1-epimerase